jgi:phytoene dehydrogenase-like protein
MERYNLIVIGGGSGGLTVAAIAAILGARVALLEKGQMGGDLKRAEEMFRKGLEQDPQFTAMRVGLGKTLIKLGRVTEAQRELQTVLDEKAPSNPADWAMRDTRETRALLEALKGKS